MSSEIAFNRIIIDLPWLKTHINGTTPAEIYSQLSSLITSAEISIHTILPPIKEIAVHLNYSTRTLYDVFHRLYDEKRLNFHGRKKIWIVINSTTQPLPENYHPLSDELDLLWLKANLADQTLTGIYHYLSRLINRGKIKIGTVMPSLSDVADTLEVSIHIIQKVWKKLQDEGVFASGYKKRMVVVKQFSDKLPLRLSAFNQANKKIELDLTYSRSEPALLPDLRQALLNAEPASHLNHYQYQSITPDLESAVQSTWPYPAEAFMTVSTTLEGISLLLASINTRDISVAVETPTLIGVIDILNKLNVKVYPIECDQYGPISEKLSFILAHKPTLFLYQPNIHMPCGHSVTEQRINELAQLFNSYPDTYIVECDLAGDLVQYHHQALSLGKYYPEQTVYIRSYAKAYGPDLRLTIISGSYSIIQQIKGLRAITVDSDSRLLQQALAWFMKDELTQYQLKQAQDIYVKRLNKLIDTLHDLGITFEDCRNIGQNVWLPVSTEQQVVSILAAEGILVLGGSHFMVKGSQKMQEYIRVSTSLLSEEHIEYVANILTKALYLSSYNNAGFSRKLPD